VDRFWMLGLILGILALDSGRASAEIQYVSVDGYSGPLWTGHTQFIEPTPPTGFGFSNTIPAHLGHFYGYLTLSGSFFDPAFSEESHTYTHGNVYFRLGVIGATGGAGGGTTIIDHVPYSFKVILGELDRNWQVAREGTLVYTGMLNGTIWPDHFQVSNTLTSPLTQSMMLGNDRFVVRLWPDAPVLGTDPWNRWPTTFYARVSVNGVEETPEPSTLWLAGFGLGCIALVGVRAWRKPHGVDRPAYAGPLAIMPFRTML
jgi:hypothetical protein